MGREPGDGTSGPVQGPSSSFDHQLMVKRADRTSGLLELGWWGWVGPATCAAVKVRVWVSSTHDAVVNAAKTPAVAPRGHDEGRARGCFVCVCL